MSVRVKQPDPDEPRKRAYVLNMGTKCPVCKSTNLDYGDINDSVAGAVTQDVVCASCESTWTDLYRLATYEDLLDMPEQIGREL